MQVVALQEAVAEVQMAVAVEAVVAENPFLRM
jgi:hypothetical protein